MRRFPWSVVVLAVALVGCGGPPNPLSELRTTYAGYDEYQIILEDMRNVGTFGNRYEHKYRVLYTDQLIGGDAPRVREALTDWRPVSGDLYRQYQDMLGLVVLSKQDGQVSEDAFPPAFAYVGDPRFGQWQTDAAGNEFWTWFAAYTILDSLDDAFEGKHVRRRHYDEYRRYAGSGGTYTAGGLFGTKGRATKVSNPSFYQRQAARQAQSSSSFSSRVNSRVGRSTGSSFRGGSGGFGK